MKPGIWVELMFLWDLWKRRNVKISVLEQRIRDLEQDNHTLRDRLQDLRRAWLHKFEPNRH